MSKIIFLLISITALISAGSRGKIYQIDNSIKKRIVGKSWKRGCPVPLYDLRYLKIPYIDFNGHRRVGEMIVHKTVAEDVLDIFDKLYRKRYPIRRMELISNPPFNADDFTSIEYDNTSAFNCRPVTGGTKWSNHSYGKAIDINPLENPYISRSGKIAHTKSLKYRRRVRVGNSPEQRAMILKNDYIVRLFKSKGWRWGGDWHSIKDYQHFDKPIKHIKVPPIVKYKKPKPVKAKKEHTKKVDKVKQTKIFHETSSDLY